MKRILILIMPLLLFLSTYYLNESETAASSPSQTLPSGEWWSWVFVPQMDELHLLNEDGLQATIPRPRMPNEASPADANPQVSISPDSRYLVLAATLSNSNTGLGFYSLERRLFVQTHEAMPNEYIILATGQPFAALSTMYDPSGQFIAIGLATPTTNAWRVVVFDVASGNALHVIDNTSTLIQQVFPSLPRDVPMYPKVVYFEGETIHIQLVSYNATTENNPSFAWSPLTPNVEISPYQRARLDILPETGMAVFPYVDPTTEARPSTDTFVSFNAIASGIETLPNVLRADSTHYHWTAMWAAGGDLVLYSTGISEVDLPRWNVLRTASSDVDVLDSSIRSVHPLPNGFLSISDTGVIAFHSADDPSESRMVWFIEGQADVYIVWTLSANIEFGLTSIPDIPQAVVNAQNLNVRENPGDGGRILEVVHRGDPLSLIGRLSDQSWLQVVTSDGTTGWVFVNLLQVNIDVATLPIVNASIIRAPTAVPPTIPPPPSGPPVIEFFIADDLYVTPGSCVTLAWSVTNAQTLTLSYSENAVQIDEAVPLVGSTLKCVGIFDYPYWTFFSLTATNELDQAFNSVTIWVSSEY